MNSLPFKFSQNISHKHPALHSSVNGVVVFEECKHIPAVFHRQTSDQLLHHLSKTRTRSQVCIRRRQTVKFR